MVKLKIAASTYLNSAPLIYSFLQGSLQNNCQFLGDTAPSRCADLLKNGLVDVALIPAIEYQRISNISLISGVSVASKTTVRSVILVTQCPINKLRSIALDISSRTSVALLQIILEKFYKIKPKYSVAKPNLTEMLKENDGALLIGDPAITIDKERYYQIYDLAKEWRSFTNLPFVFACWAVANKFSLLSSDNPINGTQIINLFAKAKEEGLANLEIIAKNYSKDLELPVDFLLEYLTENVNYDLDSENLAGLTHFYKLAKECELTNQTTAIKFLS
jgi:chorismate dehydratase